MAVLFACQDELKWCPQPCSLQPRKLKLRFKSLTGSAAFYRLSTEEQSSVSESEPSAQDAGLASTQAPQAVGTPGWATGQALPRRLSLSGTSERSQ